MSSLGLGALAALAAGYLDAKHMIGEDLTTASTVLGLTALVRIKERLGAVNNLYLIENNLYKRPNSIALVYPRQITKDLPKDPMASLDSCFQVERYTYAEMFDYARKYAHVFYHEYGIRNNDVVAMDCTNTPQFIFIWLGLWTIGAVPAFINYNLSGNSLLHCIKISGSRYVLTDMEVADNVMSIGSDIAALHKEVVFLDDQFDRKVQSSPQLEVSAKDRNEGKKPWDPGMYIYTSGTTGMPKSAIFSWNKCAIGGGSYAMAMRMKSKDVVYSPMPLYHSTAAALGFMSIMIAGGTYAIGHKFSTRTFWTQAKLSGATYAQYVGEVCRYLLNSPEGPDDKTHGVRVAIGNGMRTDIWANFKKRFNIAVIGEFYGATELPTALTNFQAGDIGIGAIGKYGKILRSFLFRVRYSVAKVDKEDPNELYRDPNTGFGQATGPDEPGELLIRIPNPKAPQEVFQGYSNDKASTDKKIVRDFYKKGDAWVRSGDLLRLDKQGLAYFVDRMGDTFRWKSENVSTNEVEEAFSGVPGVKQVVCVGVKVPNHEGRAGFAVVIPTDSNNLPDLKAIAKQVTSKLPKYAVPVFIKFAKGELENTGTMKVQKAKYRKQQIPSDDETIYFMKNGSYEPVTADEWSFIKSGRSKL